MRVCKRLREEASQPLPGRNQRAVLIDEEICLVDLSGCGATFAPPLVTTELARTGSAQYAEIVMLYEGRALFVSRCIECHTLPPFWHYRAEDWPHIVDTMAERVKLKSAERDAIVAYILTVRAQ